MIQKRKSLLSFFYFILLNRAGIAALYLLLAVCSAVILLSLPKFPFSINSDNFGKTPQVSEETDKTEELNKTVIIRKGDTLKTILQAENLPAKLISKISLLAQKEKLTSKLQVGKSIDFHYTIKIVENSAEDFHEEHFLNSMVLDLGTNNSVEFVQSSDGGFIVNYISSTLDKVITKYETNILGNVTSSLKKIGLSAASIAKVIEAYSHQIDFQRQIKPGDKITVITEKFVTADKKFSHHGNILFASITSKGKKYEIYRYSPTGKSEDAQFFSDTGLSIKSSLLKTPVNAARISSHYGYRDKHPILGYGTMHRGVDFAAPKGTPIHAAGDGKVKFIGWKSGYGRFLVVQHNNKLSTAYAHISKFANNLKHGERVKQGQIIAYVGNTGNSTGAHLHYEVRIDDKQVNPLKFKTIPGIKLVGEKLANFNKHKLEVRELNLALDKEVELAESSVNHNLF